MGAWEPAYFQLLSSFRTSLWLYTRKRSPSRWNVQRMRLFELISRLSESYCVRLLSWRSDETFTSTWRPNRSCWKDFTNSSIDSFSGASTVDLFRSPVNSTVSSEDGRTVSRPARVVRVPV